MRPLCQLLLGLLICCQIACVSSGLTKAKDIRLFSASEGPLSCKEVGTLDETDGRMSLTDCDCHHPQLDKGTESGFIRRLQAAAASRGANAVWLLRSWSGEAATTHFESCCSVTGFRGIGIAYRCSASELSFEERRKSAALGPPPNQSFERTGLGALGSLRSVSVLVARRSTQIR